MLDARVAQGTALYQAGQHQKAADVLGPVLAADPANDGAALILADCMVQLDRPRDALELANQVVSRDPQSLDGLAIRARALSLIGAHEGAAETARIRTQIAPHDGPVWSEYAVLSRNGTTPHKDRVAAAKRGVALEPNSAYTHFALGVVLSDKEPLKAAKSLRAALAIEPHNAQAQLFLAKSQARTGRLGSAISMVLQLVKERPDDPGFRFWTGYILSRSLLWFAGVSAAVVIAEFKLRAKPILSAETWAGWLYLLPALLLLVGGARLAIRFGPMAAPALRLMRQHMKASFVALWMVVVGVVVLAFGVVPDLTVVVVPIGGALVCVGAAVTWIESRS